MLKLFTNGYSKEQGLRKGQRAPLPSVPVPGPPRARHPGIPSQGSVLSSELLACAQGSKLEMMCRQ